MKIFLVLFFMTCFMLPSFSEDWKKKEEEYNVSRAKQESASYPQYYKSDNYIFDSEPELGIGLHEVTPEALDMIKDLNIRFVRVTLYWSEIENTSVYGVYNLEAIKKYDKIFDLMKEKGVIPVVVVHGNPLGTSFDTRQSGYKRFTDFMCMAVGRWKYVRYWELWNEMDAAFTDLFGAMDPNIPKLERGKYYAEFLEIAYPAIKAANKDAIILSGSVTDADDFITGMYEGGAKNFFDIMNIHTYGLPLEWSFVMRGEKLKDIMKKYGDENKPVWNTEFGVCAGAIVTAWGVPETDPLGFFDNNQRDMIKSCIEFNQKSGTYSKYFIYNFKAVNEGEKEIIEEKISFPAGQTIDDYGFGMVRNDGKTPKPIYDWIKKNNKKYSNKSKSTLIDGKRIYFSSDYPTEIK